MDFRSFYKLTFTPEPDGTVICHRTSSDGRPVSPIIYGVSQLKGLLEWWKAGPGTGMRQQEIDEAKLAIELIEENL